MTDHVCPARHAWATLEEIKPSDKGRPYNPHEVLALKESIAAIGLQTPLTVIERDGRLVLVAGRHRLEALRLLKAEKAPVRIVDFDDAEARLWQISENLHRNELPMLQRAEQIEEWRKLTAEKRGAQVEPPLGGAQPHDTGVKATARELGISRPEVQRAAKIAALPAEVKAAAVDHGLDDNASALLEAAKQPTPERQVAALKQRAEASVKRKSQLTKYGREQKAAKAKAARLTQIKPAHDLASPEDLPPAGEIAGPLRNLVNCSAGEFARWIKLTTPNDRPHVVRMLRMTADILDMEEHGEIGDKPDEAAA